VTSDEQLMSAAGKGDMDAFRQLVERHQQVAVGTACRFVGDRTTAEDIAQEAFLRLLERAADYEPRARFRTYLFSVIWHLCVDFHRRSGRRAAGPVEGLADPASGPAQAADRREREALVRRAVDALPARQRMALILKHFEGLSYEEVAGALGCSVRAVDSLLSRARARLRDELQDVL
jgi:RNA polymerase sigma-70 factor (ECF subfamily)